MPVKTSENALCAVILFVFREATHKVEWSWKTKPMRQQDIIPITRRTNLNNYDNIEIET